MKEFFSNPEVTLAVGFGICFVVAIIYKIPQWRAWWRELQRWRAELLSDIEDLNAVQTEVAVSESPVREPR